MHELAITCGIVDVVAEAAGARRVRRVTVEIGALCGVTADSVAFCFDEVAKGTACEGAVLDIRRIEGRGRCAACRAEFATPALYTPCTCGSVRIERLQGEELNVKSMELEAA